MDERREELLEKKVDELRSYASKLGITNSKQYKKSVLVEVILDAEIEKTSPFDEPAVKENEVEAVEGTEEKNDVVVCIDMDKKMKYIKDAPIGAIVAFKVPNSKVIKSAKIIKRKRFKRLLKLETAYGKQYIVSYDDIIWVRTGERWPTGVLKALKEGAVNAV